VRGDPDGARAKAEKEFSIHGQLPSYRAMLDREGAARPGDVALVGDEDTVAAQIKELADAGVTDFTAAEYGREQDREQTRGLLKTIIAAGQPIAHRERRHRQHHRPVAQRMIAGGRWAGAYQDWSHENGTRYRLRPSSAGGGSGVSWLAGSATVGAASSRAPAGWCGAGSGG
jgi:hypothetical protein